ncbi:MAG: hypothetical protein VXZ78_05590, partial [Pseudomonadota bacterium]|nr:hypothetical protein [Pseudomonadota bacterium]
KTQNSLIRSQKKLSMVIVKDTLYFNNSIGDISAVNLDNGELLWQAEIQAACIDLDGKPRRMPATTVDQMAPWLTDKPPDFNAPQRG